MPFYQEEEFKKKFKFENGIVLSEESNILEFKKSFNWGNKEDYIRVMVSFANNEGGYMIFGIRDKPQEILGLNNDKFENIDRAKISRILNNYFTPEIKWERTTKTINDTKIGILYINEASEKPIICKKNGDKLREGDIYFRYNGKTERIRYSELRWIIKNETEKYMNRIRKIMDKIFQRGIDKIALYDAVEGKIYGKNKDLIVDESLVSQMKTINEGSFKKIEGKPTLKLIGNVEKGKVITTNYQIRTEQIVKSFLNENLLENVSAINYLEQLPFESSAYLPIYFFLNKTDISKKKLEEIFEKSKSSLYTKKILKKRLKQEKKDLIIGSIKADTHQANLRRQCIKLLLNKNIKINDLEKDNKLKYLLEAITHINKTELIKIKKYALSLLYNIFEEYYFNNEFDIKGSFRKALCYLDYILYEPLMK